MFALQLSRVPWLAFLCISGASASAQRTEAQHADSAHSGINALARDASDLDSLIARALMMSPTLAAARERVTAARSRVGPAGARPDPVLTAGLQNQPLSGTDPMTMHMIGIAQTIPYPGKLALRARVAQRDVDAALARVEDARAALVHDIRTAYYELAYLDQASRITEQNRALLVDVVRTIEARYSVGSGMQQDVLEARLDLARLAQDANAIREQRAAQLAALNALLDRSSETPLDSARIPPRIVHAAVPDSAVRVRFASNDFGASVADSSLPSLESLQSLAIANSPMLREHESRIAAQSARVALAQKAVKPDIDVSLQYGQRNGFTDMVSAVVSVPIAIQRRQKQDETVVSERAELNALEAEHHGQLNELRARIARLYADAERQRTRLALDLTAVLPQARATLSAATADYQAGKADIIAVLQSRAALFSYETSYYRALTDFAETMADLEQAVGKEVLP